MTFKLQKCSLVHSFDNLSLGSSVFLRSTIGLPVSLRSNHRVAHLISQSKLLLVGANDHVELLLRMLEVVGVRHLLPWHVQCLRVPPHSFFLVVSCLHMWWKAVHHLGLLDLLPLRLFSLLLLTLRMAMGASLTHHLL